MTHYKVERLAHFTNFILVEMSFEPDFIGSTEVVLPAWRPGRYELANYAKNVRNFKATTGNKQMSWDKTSRNCWVIDVEVKERVTISYEYFAFQPDAGGAWCDEKLMYFNPVNCLMYCRHKIDHPIELQLVTFDNEAVATGLAADKDGVLLAENFDHLADCPIMVSAHMKNLSFDVKGVGFTIWMYGECTPDMAKIEADCKAYALAQIEMMGGFPATEFLFLCLFTPYKSYHGVEHHNSTVILLGPGKELMSKEVYTDFLGVCSHELFHAWNVKYIRPTDLLPYDFTKENYSKLGFVYEGFTTYYGDLFLARSQVFGVAAYFKEIDQYLDRHTQNYGRFHMSVAEASFETWVDGYVPGTPNRKTSIYVEGMLNALLLDLKIRRLTSNAHSLDDLMRYLYTNNRIIEGGYTLHDLLWYLHKITAVDFKPHFEKHIFSPGDLTIPLREKLYLVGCKLQDVENEDVIASRYGFILDTQHAITAIAPQSIAAIKGLGINDKLHKLAGKNDFIKTDLLSYSTHSDLLLEFVSPLGLVKQVVFNPNSNGNYFKRCTIMQVSNPSEDQKQAFEKWCGLAYS